MLGQKEYAYVTFMASLQGSLCKYLSHNRILETRTSRKFVLGLGCRCSRFLDQSHSPCVWLAGVFRSCIHKLSSIWNSARTQAHSAPELINALWSVLAEKVHDGVKFPGPWSDWRGPCTYLTLLHLSNPHSSHEILKSRGASNRSNSFLTETCRCFTVSLNLKSNTRLKPGERQMNSNTEQVKVPVLH
jgi:hypothetical protein